MKTRQIMRHHSSGSVALSVSRLCFDFFSCYVSLVTISFSDVCVLYVLCGFLSPSLSVDIPTLRLCLSLRTGRKMGRAVW